MFDITDLAASENAIDAIEREVGPADILINNAAFDVYGKFVDLDPRLWDRVVAVNLIGALNMHKAVLTRMAARGKGRVVNVASEAARVGSYGEAVYSACKAGLIGLTKTLASEHARQGITLNVVCPGPTETPMLSSVLQGHKDPMKLKEAFRKAIPMGRFGLPQDIAAAVAFLASEDAGFVTGQVLSVSGGLTMVG